MYVIDQPLHHQPSQSRQTPSGPQRHETSGRQATAEYSRTVPANHHCYIPY